MYFSISRMEQSGVLTKIRLKWTKHVEKDCLNPDSGRKKKIEFKMVISAFFMLGCFFIIAPILLIFEKVKKCRHDDSFEMSTK